MSLAISPVFEMVLESLRASTLRHGTRNLREHLIGTASILTNWNEPDDVVALGLFHSIYSTPFYRQQAAPSESRPMLSELLGVDLESRIFAFSMLAMGDIVSALSSSTESTIQCFPAALSRRQLSDGPREVFLPRHQAEDFLVVHIANILEQDRSSDGGPGIHLSRCVKAAELLEQRAPYLKQHVIGSLELHQELHLRDLYEEALSWLFKDRTQAVKLLNEALTIAPFMAELYAVSALAQQEDLACGDIASLAKEMFRRRGVPWDHRLTLDEWAVITDHHPELLEKVCQNSYCSDAIPLPPRFYRYLRRISQGGPNQLNSGWYPGLTSAPIHDSSTIPLGQELEENFDSIQTEVNALSEEEFHSEAEPIKRTGRWEVLMLFETGKKHVDVCRRLPTLTSILEKSKDVRTSAGLVYLSRLRPHTHVAAHRGGTNSRLRLHLGIRIPKGDCAMRVHDKRLTWEPGKAIVFDDYYEHEVWNETDEERLILLVDIWHPELTEQERIGLDSINKQIASQAVSRARYWNANTRQKIAESRNRLPLSVQGGVREQVIV